MLELSDVERLIVEQAFVNAVGKDVKTKDPDNLRGQVDEMMKEAYYSGPLAGKSFDLLLMGQKVGTYTLTVSKPKPQETTVSLEIDDKAEFMAWAEENGYVEKVADMDAVLSDFSENGVVPSGCTPIEVVKPEVIGGKVTRTTIKVDSKEVARVLGNQLEPVVRGILTGGE